MENKFAHDFTCNETGNSESVIVFCKKCGAVSFAGQDVKMIASSPRDEEDHSVMKPCPYSVVSIIDINIIDRLLAVAKDGKDFFPERYSENAIFDAEELLKTLK